MLQQWSDYVRVVNRKVRRSLRDRTFGTKARRHARNMLAVPAISLVANHRLSKADRSLDLTTGFRDHRGTSLERRCSDVALNRLILSFNAAEAAGARSCPPELEVRGVWAEWLDLHYGRLRRILREARVEELRILLENIHRDPMSTGVGGTRDDVERVPRPLVSAYYRALWAAHRDRIERIRPDWDDVASPVAGNPHGAWVGGRLVQIETLEKAYYATRLLQLFPASRPCRILEIGAGMGGQAYQFLALSGGSVSSYTILDLPEVSVLSGYILMASLGEQRVALFGEPTPDGALVNIQPHWAIDSLPDLSADLIFNSFSFSEMDSLTCRYYVNQIERLCGRYFFHVNHETRFRYRLPNDAESINTLGSEIVPDSSAFQLICRTPRQVVRPENRANVAFEWLYQRESATA